MTRFWVVTVMAACGRLVAIVAAALTVGAVVAYVGEWVYSAIRYAPDWNVGILPLVFILQIVVAGWVVWSALKRDVRTLLRNLLVAFALSFLLSYGWYFLLLGGGSDPVAIGNLLYLLAGLLMVPAALVGDARREPAPRAIGAGAKVLGVLLFVTVAATAGYAAILPMPPEAQAIAPPDKLPCPEYLGEEIAAFEGSGDRTTPAFETPGYWGYEYASSGYGTLRITVLAETGDVVYGSDEPAIQAGSVGGADFALGPGTFRLGIDADDDAKYAVVVCEEADSSNGSRGSPDQRPASREHPPPPNDEPVSDVVGMKAEEACATLARSGYRGVFAGEPVDDPARPGHVVGQHPPPESTGFKGRLVHLLVSRSSSDRSLQLPPGCVNSPG